MGLPRLLSGKNLPAVQKTQETQARSLSGEDPLEEEIATHSSILAWRIPWTGEPGKLQSMGSKEQDKTERLNMHTQEIEIRSYSLEENIYKPSLWGRTCISLCKNSQNLTVKLETIQQKISKGINRHLTVEKIQLSNKHIKKIFNIIS